MDRATLTGLMTSRGMTFADLEAKQPQLAATLAKSLRDEQVARFRAALADVPPDVRTKVEAVDVSDPAADPIASLNAKLAAAGVDKATISNIAARAKSAGLGTGPDPGTALGADPSVGMKLANAQVHDVLDIAKISGAAADTIAASIASPGHLNDAALAKLVAKKLLTDTQASQLGYSTSLYSIVGGDAALAAAVRDARFSALGNEPATSTSDLARLSSDDWSRFFASGGAKLPAGASAQSAGKAMAARFAALHPTIALLGRLPTIEATRVTSMISDLAPLFQRNQRVIGSSFDKLNTTGLSSEQLHGLETTHDELATFARAYPGLGLDTVLDDPHLAPAAKATTVAHRIGLVQNLASRLADTHVLQLDLAPEGNGSAKLGLDGIGATADEQNMIVSMFRTYQRAWSVARDHDDARTLVEHGYTSALSISTQPRATFERASGLALTSAAGVWDKSRTMLADVSLTVGSILDIEHGLFDKMGAGNQPSTIQEYLKRLAGYEDLFGSLSFCDCEECQSILGPAAYFVDLMKFIDENLRNQLAAHPQHPLDLKTRRPDLWTLELTCDNTTTRIPTLDLVDEILENYIALKTGYTEALTDRAAVQAQVYKQELASSVDSFQQPFHLPLARVRSYLTAMNRSAAAIAAALGADGDTQTRAELGLSSRELQLITDRDVDLAHQSHLYGIAFGGSASAVAAVDASVLGPAMGLNRDELGQIVAASFVAAGGAAVSIHAAKKDANSVQNDIEWVNGLTADALDRMHRFTRLVRKSGWSIPELDLVLSTLGDTSLSSLAATARLHAIQDEWKLSVAEACALVGALPQVPANASLFDRLFNTPSFVAADGAYPKPTTRFIDPAFRSTTSAPVDPAVPRLLLGLAIDLDGLTSLARHLAAVLKQESHAGFDPDAPHDDDRYFVLSAENLSLLYRHARAARLLGVDVETLFQMLSLLGIDHLSNADDLASVLDLSAWTKANKLSVDDVAVVVGQVPRDASRYPDPATIATQVTASAASALTFTDTVFAVALGTTEQGSRELVSGNPALFESTTQGTWRLKPGIDLSAIAITIPATATVPTPPSGTRAVTDAEVREALEPYLASEALTRTLAGILRFATNKVVALAALAGQSLTSDAVTRAVRGDGPLAPLVAVIAAVRPLAVAFASTAWDAAAIELVRSNPGWFGAAPLPQTTTTALHPNAPFLDLAQLRALTAVASITLRPQGTAPDAPHASAADVQAVLLAFDPHVPGFPSASDAAMARVLGAPVGLVVGLRGRITLPSVAAAALDRVDRAVQLAQALGVDGETLGSFASDDYDTLSRAADAICGAFGASFVDDATRATKLDQAEQPVREAKRDALADYLIRSISPSLWDSLDELYEYFLIDVAAGGCSTTSRVVAATMSAQLYVHRAIMNLEQDGLPPTDPDHISLRMPSDAAAEWSWRQNYRVWQANRKVFLWPENYLDPDLRDDKTPLFEELEGELLQTDISDQNVADAYAKYLAGFEELSSLSIAGAYVDKLEPGAPTEGQPQVFDVLHLFGATASDPPIYYYRTCQNLLASARDPGLAAVWSPWQKITVQITGRKVSPVVHRGRLHVFFTDVKTKSFNQVKDGTSTFSGYVHNMSLKFITLRPDGVWTPAQEVKLGVDSYFFPGSGQVVDALGSDGVAPLDPKKRAETEALEDYTLSGPNWDWAWLQSAGSELRIQLRDFLERVDVDLFARRTYAANWGFSDTPNPRLLCAKNGSPTRPLFTEVPAWMFWPAPGYANAIIDEGRLDTIGLELPLLKYFFMLDRVTDQIATIPSGTELLALPGSEEDAILQVGRDIILLQGSVTDDGNYVVRRLGTTLVEEIARKLFEEGLDSLLDIETQLALAEAGIPITPVSGRIDDRSNAGKLDFAGAYGSYYRELYFHIPFLIANALSSRGRYEAAQRWYHYIFDPTATEVIDTTGVPPAEVAHRLLDRVWRYREFRGLDTTRLRDLLSDQAAIAAYKTDPFNPWAIARRRIGALQKTIVMKYVDNLLDWADSLFTQFTMESVNEAMMLYIMASDVLGPRPVELGDCGAGVQPMSYDHIGPLVDGSSEMLVELETWILGWRYQVAQPSTIFVRPKYVLDPSRVAHAVAAFPLGTLQTKPEVRMLSGASASRDARAHLTVGAVTAPIATVSTAMVPTATAEPVRTGSGIFRGLGWTKTRTTSWGPALGNSAVKTADKLGGRSFDHAWNPRFSDWVGRFGWCIIRQLTPVFCVPVNADLLAYWDRVEDRLYKIRHCLDIDGQKRELALFAPPINPMQLVAMKAAGLSLEDMFGAGSGSLPPYRFLYLIERAKAFASTLSGFGAALLSSLERKDGEQLNRLRLTQQINLAQLTSQIRQLEIQVASESLEALNQQLDAADYRSDFYAGLVSGDRNSWEMAESIARHTASGLQAVEATVQLVRGIVALIPQLGSPFAMKYGGLELQGSAAGFAAMAKGLASVAEAVAVSTALEANFARRTEGWKHQQKLADYDAASLTKQVKAAEIRLDIANRALDLHQKGIDQIQEQLDLADSRFTNLGLYTWLASKLQRTYRDAFQNALALAKLAEQAYRFERGDDTLPGLSMSYWDPTHAGLLAGEQLLVDLQTLERRFLETNYRCLEIDQAFALSQIDASALVSLRETGECSFELSEVFFDLFYPGHYKRRIKGVRLTIPCITGPYVNVSATLSLERSWIRPSAQTGVELVEVPPTRSVTVATSTAQNDAGVFELSFRDERYMPFEGLGAVSRWHLTLPKSFKQFDYQTINDVILSVSYTAVQDGDLRARVESTLATTENGIVTYFSSNPARRLFSLRQDFSSAFTRLLRSPQGAQVKLELTDRNFPLFVTGRGLSVTRCIALLRTASGAPPAGFQLSVDGAPVTGFAADPTLGSLPAKPLPAAFASNLRAEHTFVIDSAGDLAPPPAPGTTSAVDAGQLLDILIYVEYQLA